jgi:hypothetical protein
LDSIVADGTELMGTAGATVGKIAHAATISCRCGEIVTAYGIGTEKYHYRSPLDSVGPYPTAMEKAGYKVRYFMRYGLIDEYLAVFSQHLAVIPDDLLALGIEDHHASRFAAQIESDFWFRDQNAQAFGC